MNDLQPQQPQANPDEQSDKEYKELLEKVKAAITVHRHNNQGKVPSLNDVSAILEQGNQEGASQEEGDDNVPKCLNMVIYHGKDATRPVYYHDPHDMGYFDVKRGSWQLDTPEMLEHLQSREPQGEDLFNFILHGVMDDESYGRLESAGMIDPKAKELKKKIDSMRQHQEELQKSIDEVSEQETAPEMFMEQTDPEFDFDQKDILTDCEEPGEDTAPGADLVAEMIKAALSPSSCPPGLLAIIQQQIAIALGKGQPEVAAEITGDEVETGEPKDEGSPEKDPPEKPKK